MGPTASGKTDIAISLAKKMPIEMISVDSAMVYRDMNIGTAKPSEAELRIVPHHLINLCDPAEHYSVGQFCTDALREINHAFAKNRAPLFVGGTMLYFHKLLFGLAELPTANADIRDTLTKEAEKIGWNAMHEKLQQMDPVAAAKIKPKDPQRIQRALEVFLIMGKPISELQKINETPLLNVNDVILVALIPNNRHWLHDRIEKRFDRMLENGFLDEVRALRERGDLNLTLPSMRIVGYRQAWEFLDKKIDFETMRLKAIAATRQLAKRQLTWLRCWKNVVVFDPEKDLSVVADYLISRITNNG